MYTCTPNAFLLPQWPRRWRSLVSVASRQMSHYLFLFSSLLFVRFHFGHFSCERINNSILLYFLRHDGGHFSPKKMMMMAQKSATVKAATPMRTHLHTKAVAPSGARFICKLAQFSLSTYNVSLTGSPQTYTRTTKPIICTRQFCDNIHILFLLYSPANASPSIVVTFFANVFPLCHLLVNSLLLLLPMVCPCPFHTNLSHSRRVPYPKTLND